MKLYILFYWNQPEPTTLFFSKKPVGEPDVLTLASFLDLYYVADAQRLQMSEEGTFWQSKVIIYFG